ncbi:Damage-control phosphatase [Sesamum angolense]|uniref:Damage-control phosphatase n=1 Tax=Sesamum angolense TaxID=2727404 RepID=A0AAE1WX38_9LAMI|nr:Damage-control phosphatase [Sesamum angolense]
MESSGEMVPLPVLMESNYRACTIPYRFPSDNPKKPTPTELSWINLFANSIPSFRSISIPSLHLSDDFILFPTCCYYLLMNPIQFYCRKRAESDDTLLCQLREQVLREVGFRDIFKKVKEEENAKAISLFQDVVRLNDAIDDEAKRVENLIRGSLPATYLILAQLRYVILLAGCVQLELMLLGLLSSIISASSYEDMLEELELFAKDGMSFQASCQNLVPRPWVIDDLDNFISKWGRKSWKKAIIFVDNSGADIILGILPFARELLRHSVQVVLAANDLPSINDVTYDELIEIIAKLKDENGKLFGVDASNLLIVNSGNDLPVIDLSRVSQELAYLASDADLVILEGMGRGIETNLYAQFRCDSMKIAMVKHPEVAQFLGGRLQELRCRLNCILLRMLLMQVWVNFVLAECLSWHNGILWVMLSSVAL